MIVNGYEIRPFSCLRKANLEGVNLHKVELRWANLTEANLCGANLSGANLYGANLYGANLCEANLTGADLRRADLVGAILLNTNVHVLQFGKHFGFIHEKILVIGCKTFKLKDVNRKMLKELGEAYYYTDAEIRHYSGHIMFTKKLLDEGVIR